MLRITPIKNSKSAKDYYTNALEKGDYYIKDVELENYKGELAKMLGLDKVQVSKENFCKLTDNLNPLTGDKITMGADRVDRKPMYDFTFSVPKSVSILYALTEDEKLQADILKTFNDCVDYAMEVGEKELSLTRDQRNGKNEYIQTGKLLYAGFQHETSRPVDGIPDPHLHKHCTVMNMTYDETTGKYKAMEFLDFCSSREFMEAVFESELAHRLQHNLGLACVNKNKSFELSGYTDEMIAVFSRRTTLIDNEAEKKMITDPNRKAELGKKTRESKKEIKDVKVVKADWKSRANNHENIKSILSTPDKFNTSSINKDLVISPSQLTLESGLRHYLQYESTPLKSRLITFALKKDIANQSYKSISKVYDRNIQDKNYLEGKNGRKEVITTQAVINEENRILELVNNGLSGSNPINSNAKPDPKLTEEQAKIFKQVMTSTASINYIKGDAGTGKTFTINELQKGIKEAGYSFQAYAPTAIAGRKVLREEVTENANTLQAFLLSENLQRNADSKTVVVVDEAGTIGNENMLKLLELQRINGFKLAMVGDTKQNQPTERGAPLMMIEERSNIVPLTLTQNYRQKGNPNYQQAVNHFAKMEVKEGLEILDKMNAIHETPKASERNTLVAKEYVTNIINAKNFETGLKENIIVIPTHAEASKVTKKIREELRKEKIIGKVDIDYTILRDKELSEEQKTDIRNYEKSDKILFTNNHTDGILKGSTWDLKWNKEDKKFNMVQKGNESNGYETITRDLPTDHPKKFNVMIEDKIKLTKGDQILITSATKDQNNRDILNKSRYTIDKIQTNEKTGDKTILLNNGYVLPANFKSINYGFISTSYSSQGITAKNGIVTHTQESIGAIDFHEWYTKVTRAMQNLSVHTDNKAKMYNSVSQVRQKGFGLDVVNNQGQDRKDHEKQKQLTK
jgi:conjugative relaxase-like TrwC/TraI family protein